MSGSRSLRIVLQGIGVLVVCLPVAAVLTLVLLPLWSWLEATYGIESVGHSGPADWCYWLTFGATVAIVTVLLWTVLSRREAEKPRN